MKIRPAPQGASVAQLARRLEHAERREAEKLRDAQRRKARIMKREWK